MTVTAPTTIAGVSVLAEGGPSGDPFDIAISHECIEIRRIGQPPRRMSWDRVREWELEERADHVVLTFRGEGATTPLLITGWSAEELEVLLRTVTSGGDGDAPVVAAVVMAAPATASASAIAAPASDPVAEVEPPQVETRRQRRRTRRLRVRGKAVLTVALLLVLAAAVTVVLLQSAGIIDWGFLGPTA
jgi:hypothetical protein